MEPSHLPLVSERAAATTVAGELVVLNGRQSGTRRALGVPTTFIGRAASCDVRLNVEGVEPFHCVLTYHAGDASVRDLNSAQGTFVNGQRIAATVLLDGDLIDVGPFRFRVLLPAPRPTAAPVPAAPVPAAPVMLAEEQHEAVRIQAAAIAAQQVAIDEREAQLEKRREEAETQRQGEIAEVRLAREQLAAEAEQLGKRSAALDRVRSELQYQESDLAIQKVHLNTERELDSRLLQDGWRCLQVDQERWRGRRNRESVALRARRLLLLESERKLARTRRTIAREAAAWEAQRHELQAELHGLNSRIVHQRQHLQELEAARPAPVRPQPEAPAGPPVDAALARRSADLDRLACELADQRAQLVEQWERLARLQYDWEVRRDETANEMADLGQRLAQQEEACARREQQVDAAESRLHQRQEQLEQMRREAVLAFARAKAQQQAWQAEREQVLTECARQGEQARRQLEALETLRRKWKQRRQQETVAMRGERRACETLREELTHARRELHLHVHQLEIARRTLAEEAQALEDGTAESFAAGRGLTDQPTTPLRRRWLAQSVRVVRVLQRQRKRFAAELATLTGLQQELAAQAEQQAHVQAELLERQAALEYREASLAAGAARLEQAVRQTEQRRWSTERKLVQLQEETEHLARALIADSEPQPMVLERAA